MDLSGARIAVCHAQVPLARGGAELLVEGLEAALHDRGAAVDVVKLPYSWNPRWHLARSCAGWRLIELSKGTTPVDAVIATKFPSYYVRHPKKVVWLVHQHRQAYDLAGTPYSEFQARVSDRVAQRLLRIADGHALGEARRVFALSHTVAARLRRYNGIEAPVLYCPPPRPGAYRNDGPGDYVLTVSRLDPYKRVDLLIEAMAHTTLARRCVIAGSGPDERRLRELAVSRSVDDRVEFAGWCSDDELVDLYAGAAAVYYGPLEEDYGFITLEAFLAEKPVVTLTDAGGPLEFVVDGRNGWVVEPHADAIARALDEALGDPAGAAARGAAGRETAAGIEWDVVVDALLGGLL